MCVSLVGKGLMWSKERFGCGHSNHLSPIILVLSRTVMHVCTVISRVSTCTCKCSLPMTMIWLIRVYLSLYVQMASSCKCQPLFDREFQTPMGAYSGLYSTWHTNYIYRRRAYLGIQVRRRAYLAISSVPGVNDFIEQISKHIVGFLIASDTAHSHDERMAGIVHTCVHGADNVVE